ncbi:MULTISPECIES: divalent-cation tolerance protein CutA [unclassified Streptomyces]|uniref:divalent-cation tolerance protein CutA n=1 Tax=unclassified Streptomyces TaxID=2593676 RepID=UPI0006ADEE06|nr:MULTISPECIES: divalent-cation tolerance protein CutA [unclassified Streptomyces]KOX25596.1 cation tolerance protein CutA [Streptomyces sp. NRRL F-6491]KOX48940.1 cation tolerance protein CutA [Streptomyces sp. NRRL F-6492]
MTDNIVQVSTATATWEEAVTLAGPAVEKRLAAGAQIIGPVTSVYWHLGEYGTGEEWQVLFKTTEAQYPALEADLLERHPWDNPELCAVPVKFAAPRCAEWVRDSVTGAGA